MRFCVCWKWTLFCIGASLGFDTFPSCRGLPKTTVHFLVSCGNTYILVYRVQVLPFFDGWLSVSLRRLSIFLVLVCVPVLFSCSCVFFFRVCICVLLCILWPPRKGPYLPACLFIGRSGYYRRVFVFRPVSFVFELLCIMLLLSTSNTSIRPY